MELSRQHLAQSQIPAGGHARPPSPDPSVTSTNTSSNKRQRICTTGTRGVANLTPEQLAKKRANDREAQRAIRERTKGQIEQLEKRIQQLTEQKPYQELQHVVRQKEVVEAENEEIKRRLTSVLGIIQPLCAKTPSTDAAKVQSTSIPVPAQHYSPENLTPPQIGVGAPLGPSLSDVRSVDSGGSPAGYVASPQALRQTVLPLPYTSQPQNFAAVNNMDRTFSNDSLPNLAHNSPHDEKLELAYLLHSRSNSIPNSQSHANIDRISTRPISQNRPMHTLSPLLDRHRDCPPAYAYPPRNLPQTCPLDGLLLKFLADQRQRAIEGVPVHELAGPAYPSFRSLVNPPPIDISHPLSKVFTDMLGKFPDISTLPEQVAILYIMFIIMRWQIMPTQETYDRLPEWVTPRASQLLHPHPAWVDHLPWPRMRDRLVSTYPNVPFDDFFIPYTTTVSLNWPYDAADVLIRTPGTEEFTMNPMFETHLRDLSNWSLGSVFAKAHPVLADTCRIAVDKRRLPRE